MSLIKVECSSCRKRFSGDAEKIRSIKACPKCKHAGDWWALLEPPAHATNVPKDDDPTPLLPHSPVSPNSPSAVGPAPLQSMTPYGPPQSSTPAPRSKLPLMIIAAVVVLLAVVASGAVLLMMGDSSSVAGNVPAGDGSTNDALVEKLSDDDRKAVLSVLDQYLAVSSKLKVGMTYKDYGDAVAELQVITDKLRRTLSEDGSAIHELVAAVLDDYIFALSIWKKKIGKTGLQEDISNDWDASEFLMLTKQYGVVPYPDAFPKELREDFEQKAGRHAARKWIPYKEALSAVWQKASTRSEDLHALVSK